MYVAYSNLQITGLIFFSIIAAAIVYFYWDRWGRVEKEEKKT